MNIFRDLARELTQEAKECLSCERKPRRPYKWGAKQMLMSMAVGERKVVTDEQVNWRSIHSIGCNLARECGCEFRFHHNRKGQKEIIRLA